jgi:hypothetical protein
VTLVRIGKIDIRTRTALVTVADRRAPATAQLDTLFAGLPDPPQAAAELLVAAAGAYIADRSIHRPGKVGTDRWTRHITVQVPVADPEGWPADELAHLLQVLTNDRWTIEPYAHPPLEVGTVQQQMQFDEPDSCALFSAGLDSYAHAVTTYQQGGTPLLVGHFDMEALRGLQQRAARAAHVVSAGGARGAPLLRQMRVATVPALYAGRNPEISSRSRGLLFAAAGVAVAAAAGLTTLNIAENGFVALNTPLTAARAGALSTRSTHPHLLDLLQRLLVRLGVDVKVSNPLLYATKGEVTRAALAAGDAALAGTISCGHPISARWQGDARYMNCGYCYPCLVRRSGIESVLDGTDPTTYRHDPRTDTELLTAGSHADLFAIVAALGREPHPLDVLTVAPLPAEVDRTRLHDMRIRSHAELRDMLSNGMVLAIRTRLGL